jgi:hypothetical protein
MAGLVQAQLVTKQSFLNQKIRIMALMELGARPVMSSHASHMSLALCADFYFGAINHRVRMSVYHPVFVVFSRPSTQRLLPFAEIASVCEVPLEQVLAIQCSVNKRPYTSCYS